MNLARGRGRLWSDAEKRRLVQLARGDRATLLRAFPDRTPGAVLCAVKRCASMPNPDAPKPAIDGASVRAQLRAMPMERILDALPDLMERISTYRALRPHPNAPLLKKESPHERISFRRRGRRSRNYSAGRDYRDVLSRGLGRLRRSKPCRERGTLALWWLVKGAPFSKGELVTIVCPKREAPFAGARARVGSVGYRTYPVSVQGWWVTAHLDPMPAGLERATVVLHADGFERAEMAAKGAASLLERSA